MKNVMRPYNGTLAIQTSKMKMLLLATVCMSCQLLKDCWGRNMNLVKLTVDELKQSSLCWDQCSANYWAMILMWLLCNPVLALLLGFP